MSGWPHSALLLTVSVIGTWWGAAALATEPVVATCLWCHPTAIALQSPSGIQDEWIQPGDTAEFTHEAHLSVACESCHVGVTRLSPRDWAWCDACHHRPQGEEACDRCHGDAADSESRFDLLFALPGGSRVRPSAFPHEAHTTQECGSCHGDPLGPLEADFACETCHAEHHESATIDCQGCHEPPPSWAHEDVVVHRTCSGSVCHKTFEPDPLDAWPRSTCEACHRDFMDQEQLPPVPKGLAADTTKAEM